MRVLLWFTLALAVGLVAPAKIFSILPVKIRSHSFLYDRLFKELAKRGHQITLLTPFESKTQTENITEIVISDFQAARGMEINFLTLGSIPQILLGAAVYFTSASISDFLLQDPKVKAVIENEKFDLVFGESFIDESIVAGTAWKNNAVLITLCTTLPTPSTNYAVGNPVPASYIPDIFLGYPPSMTYFQRITNLLASTAFDIFQRYLMYSQNQVLRKHFGNDVPCLDEIWRNTSLVLVNNHPVMNFARPQLPNTIDVAGMHIYPPKPLPKEFEEYMNSAKDGVILFSLGTNVKSSDLAPEVIQGILRAFGRMKQKVIWKFEKSLENTPENVMIAQWVPQSDVLAHPNLKLFITHGGMLSTTEAIFRGIPVVGIPVFGDQPINMRNIENAGWGVTLNLKEISEETFYNAAMEVIGNPKYLEIAKQKSKLLNDSPMTPLDTAVWWIEYAIRNGGALHLKSTGQDLWYFQLHQWDTIPVLILGASGLVALDIWLLKKLYKKICGKKTTITSKAKKDK